MTVTIAPGLDHDILLEPIVIEALKNLVETLEEDASARKEHADE